MTVFGERLRELRKRRNLTQEDLCHLFKEKNGRPVTSQTISYYESGKYEPGFEGLLAVSEFFKVSPGYLLGINDDKTIEHGALKSISGLSPETVSSIIEHKELTDKLFTNEYFLAFISGLQISSSCNVPQLLEIGKILGSAPANIFTIDKISIMEAFMKKVYMNLLESVKDGV
jgi:transcriptional regulator with XRE-family HTH domain